MSALCLCLGLLLPVGSILHSFAREEADDRTARDIARITAALAPERDSLLPEDFHDTWPQRQTPSDLPPRVGLIVAVDRPGRHRAPEPDDELTTTGQKFWAIVDTLRQLEQPCAHCATPEDGEPGEARTARSRWTAEPAHAGCPGCSCPCSLVEVAA